MFEAATSFNQPLNKWDLESMINLGKMFKGATAFNQDLTDWNVCNIDFYSEHNQEFDSGAALWEASKKPKRHSPCVTQIFFNPDKEIYKLGDDLNITLRFEEDVAVSTFLGNPQVQVEFENGYRYFNYTSAITKQGGGNYNTNDLNFTYKIQEGDYAREIKPKRIVLKGGFINGPGAEEVYLVLPKTTNYNGNLLMYGSENVSVLIWNTSKAPGKSITLPLTSSGTYNFTIDWGDGTTQKNNLS